MKERKNCWSHYWNCFLYLTFRTGSSRPIMYLLVFWFSTRNNVSCSNLSICCCLSTILLLIPETCEIDFWHLDIWRPLSESWNYVVWKAYLKIITSANASDTLKKKPLNSLTCSAVGPMVISSFPHVEVGAQSILVHQLVWHLIKKSTTYRLK